MSEPRILAQVRVLPKHIVTGKTVHKLGKEVLPTPSILKIAQYRDDDGFYLFYCDPNGTEITDTYHGSVAEAMEQAKFEFGIVPDEWEKFTR